MRSSAGRMSPRTWAERNLDNPVPQAQLSALIILDQFRTAWFYRSRYFDRRYFSEVHADMFDEVHGPLYHFSKMRARAMFASILPAMALVVSLYETFTSILNVLVLLKVHSEKFIVVRRIGTASAY